MRERIREANFDAPGNPECFGCSKLQKKCWPKRDYIFDYIGIGNMLYCNLECCYCPLQTRKMVGYAKQFEAYSLLPTIEMFMEKGLISPNAVMDWGGGGEPIFYKEFDQITQVLVSYGTFCYVHTNATWIPKSLHEVSLPKNVHVICSVDAGLPETYFKLKKRDYFETVWKNLDEYIQMGINVTLKYIVKSENCSGEDMEAFIERATKIKPNSLILDVDFNFPEPTWKIVTALGRLKHMALRAGIPASYGYTGEAFSPEKNINARVEAAFHSEQLKYIAKMLGDRGLSGPENADFAVENLLKSLDETRQSLQDFERPGRVMRRLAGLLFRKTSSLF